MSKIEENKGGIDEKKAGVLAQCLLMLTLTTAIIRWSNKRSIPNSILLTDYVKKRND